MLSNRFFPYSSMQEINLDWILTKIKNILRFVPDDGSVGQILRRTAHGAEWSDEQGAGGSVTSVNGMQGAVVLTAADVGALPDTYAAPVDSVNGQTGTVVLSIPSDTADLTNTAGFVDAAGAAAAAPVQSVNGQTGAVSLAIPTDTSDLNNDSGFVDAAGAAAAAPVQSVNGQTGAVVLSIPSDTYALNEQLDISGYTSASWSNSSGKAGTVGILLPKKIPRAPTITCTLECRAGGVGQLASSVTVGTGFVANSQILPLLWQVNTSFGANNCISVTFTSLVITF